MLTFIHIEFLQFMFVIQVIYFVSFNVNYKYDLIVICFIMINLQLIYSINSMNFSINLLVFVVLFLMF